MRTLLSAILILAITSPIQAEIWHEDTPQYRMERAKELLYDLKERNWEWSSYSSRQRSAFRAEARDLQQAINSGNLRYREAYGESEE